MVVPTSVRTVEAKAWEVVVVGGADFIPPPAESNDPDCPIAPQPTGPCYEVSKVGIKELILRLIGLESIIQIGRPSSPVIDSDMRAFWLLRFLGDDCD